MVNDTSDPVNTTEDIVWFEKSKDMDGDWAPSLQELDLRPDAYTLGNFHPVFIGQIYSRRYLVLRKLGYGMYSTVWLVVNVNTDRYYAMKVLSAECYGRGRGNDTFELEILECFRKTQAHSSHPGSQYISQLHDDFGIWGPNGYSACCVFKVMAETLEDFGNFFIPAKITGNVVKRFVKQLLLALDYAHGLGVIHIGLFFILLRWQLLNQVHRYQT
jgi:serine/threonine-protein kinase SRPK3